MWTDCEEIVDLKHDLKDLESLDMFSLQTETSTQILAAVVCFTKFAQIIPNLWSQIHF